MNILNLIAKQAGPGSFVKKSTLDQSAQASDEIVALQDLSGKSRPVSKGDRHEFNKMLKQKLGEEEANTPEKPIKKNDKGEKKGRTDIAGEIPSPGITYPEKKVTEGQSVHTEVDTDISLQNRTPIESRGGLSSGEDEKTKNTVENVPKKSTAGAKIESEQTPSSPSRVQPIQENSPNEGRISPETKAFEAGTIGEVPVEPQAQDSPPAQKAPNSPENPLPGNNQPNPTFQKSEQAQTSAILNEQVAPAKTEQMIQQIKDSLAQKQDNVRPEMAPLADSKEGLDTAVTENVKFDEANAATSSILQKPTQSSPESAQAVMQRMQASSEHPNTLQSDNVQKVAENNQIEEDSGITDSTQSETASVTSSVEKPPLNNEFEKIMGRSDSKLDVSRQIQESVTQSYRPGTQQIVIRLDPPDLGRVTIRFVEQRDGITGILHVDKAQTRQDIQEALPGLVQNLQNADIQIKKLDVVLNNQQQNNASADHSADQHSGFDQQQSANHNTFGNSVTYKPWQAEIHPNADGSTIELTDKSINMLI